MLTALTDANKTRSTFYHQCNGPYSLLKRVLSVNIILDIACMLIIIRFSVAPETVVIPIVSCIFGFPLLALLVICCLRRRAQLAREQARRRDIEHGTFSIITYSSIHYLGNQYCCSLFSPTPTPSTDYHPNLTPAFHLSNKMASYRTTCFHTCTEFGSKLKSSTPEIPTTRTLTLQIRPQHLLLYLDQIIKNPFFVQTGRSSRAVSLRSERAMSRGFPSLELDTVLEERSDPERECTVVEVVTPDRDSDSQLTIKENVTDR